MLDAFAADALLRAPLDAAATSCLMFTYAYATALPNAMLRHATPCYCILAATLRCYAVASAADAAAEAPRYMLRHAPLRRLQATLLIR